MNQRPSLMEQAGVREPEPTAGKKERGGQGFGADKIKVIVAIVMLIAAVGLIGYSMGWFQGRPPKTDPDLQAQRQQQIQEQIQAEKQEEAVSRTPRTEAGG